MRLRKERVASPEDTKRAAALLRATVRAGVDREVVEREARERLEERERAERDEREADDRARRTRAVDAARAAFVVSRPDVAVPDVEPLRVALREAFALASSLPTREAIAELRDVEARARAWIDAWPPTLGWSVMVEGHACVRPEYAAAQAIGSCAGVAAHYLAEVERLVA